MPAFRSSMLIPSRILGLMTLVMVLAAVAAAVRADISPFVGTYSGSAMVTSLDGTETPRDMSVVISETRDGFQVQWTSVSLRDDGSRKEKSYTIDFVPSGRDAVYAAAMRKNVFGHQVQLDPMKGEPYVWARIDDDTLTVFSLHVAEDGGYTLQQYDRTLAEGGLDLRFQAVADGNIQRGVETFLTRE